MTGTLALRFALYLDLTILFGLPVFGLTVLRGAGAGAGRRWMVAAAGAGALLSVAALLAMVAAMAAVPVAALDRATVAAVVDGTAIGLAFRVRTAALAGALLAGLAPRLPDRLRLGVVAAAGGVALASLAWTGHGAMDEGAAGWLHLAADIAHLLAAGVWIGALVALAALLRGGAVDTQVAALDGFGRIGIVAVAVLAVSGAVNVWALLIRPGTPLLPLGDYGRLLALKTAAFAAMLALATLNRLVLTPRLARGRPTIRASLAVELALGIAVLAIVALLGTLPPGGA